MIPRKNAAKEFMKIMDETKPNSAAREFWIDQHTNKQDIDDDIETLYCGDALRHKPHTTNEEFNKRIIHVIEFKAYKKQQKIIEVLKRHLKENASETAFNLRPKDFVYGAESVLAEVDRIESETE